MASSSAPSSSSASRFNILENVPSEVLDHILGLVVEDVHDAQRYAGVSTTLRSSMHRLLLSLKITARTDAQFLQEMLQLGN